MPVLVPSYNIQYCGNCQEGFLKKILPTGEEVITPCSCKMEQDRNHLYRRIEANATIQMYGFGGWKYENKDKWLPAVVAKCESLPVTAFESLHNLFLSTTSTKFTGFSKFLKWIGEANPEQKSKNFYIDNDKGSNDRFKYFVNFIAYVLVNRLVPVKYLEYSELKSVMMDKDRNFYEFIEPYSVIIIPELFSDDFLAGSENQYVYDRVSRFFKHLYSKEDISVITSGRRSIRQIRTLDEYASKPVIRERTQAIFNTILNNSNVVCCRIPEEM